MKWLICVALSQRQGENVSREECVWRMFAAAVEQVAPCDAVQNKPPWKKKMLFETRNAAEVVKEGGGEDAPVHLNPVTTTAAQSDVQMSCLTQHSPT